MMGHLLYWLRNRSRYPSGWRSLEKATVAKHPYCAFCGARRRLQVHHIKPVHIDISSNADPRNLIVLCAWDHLQEGHLGDFRRLFDLEISLRAEANLNAVIDARARVQRELARPGDSGLGQDPAIEGTVGPEP